MVYVIYDITTVISNRHLKSLLYSKCRFDITVVISYTVKHFWCFYAITYWLWKSLEPNAIEISSVIIWFIFSVPISLAVWDRRKNPPKCTCCKRLSKSDFMGHHMRFPWGTFYFLGYCHEGYWIDSRNQSTVNSNALFLILSTKRKYCKSFSNQTIGACKQKVLFYANKKEVSSKTRKII